MELNGINSNPYSASTAYQPVQGQQKGTSIADMAADVAEKAAVYEKSQDDNQKVSSYSANKKVDQATIDKLKADAEERYSQLRDLVEKLMTKQANTHTYATLGDLMEDVVKGNISVDPETVKQAQEDVAEDGYWGVEKTAERIVSFAKALTGGDSTKVEDMRSAIEKGYKQATKSWGKDLPEISGKTISRVNEMLDKWAAGEE